MLSCVWLFEIPWTLASQAPPSMEFSRQEYWGETPFLTLGDPSDPGIKPMSLCLLHWQVDSFTTEPLGMPDDIWADLNAEKEASDHVKIFGNNIPGERSVWGTVSRDGFCQFLPFLWASPFYYPEAIFVSFTGGCKDVPIPGGTSSKESTCQCKRCEFDPWVRKILWRRKWQPTPVFLPGESHGQRSLVGYRP